MSKAFIADVLQQSSGIPAIQCRRITIELLDAIQREMKKTGRFALQSFGTFTVHKTKARKGMNPKTQERIRIKAGRTVRFKASPLLKRGV